MRREIPGDMERPRQGAVVIAMDPQGPGEADGIIGFDVRGRFAAWCRPRLQETLRSPWRPQGLARLHHHPLRPWKSVARSVDSLGPWRTMRGAGTHAGLVGVGRLIGVEPVRPR